MGYACPVCETPQADGRHLANHLAFTAMIHGDDHEAWLTEHAPGWDEAGERELATRVIEAATEIEFPPSENATNGGETAGPHGHGDHSDHHGDDRDQDRSQVRGRSPAGVAIDTSIGSDAEDEDDRDVAAVVAEARELTQRMRDGTDPIEDGEKGCAKAEENRDRNGTETEVEDENRSDGRSR